MTAEDEKKAAEKLGEAIREYHHTFGESLAAKNSVPMNWILVYSSTAIDEDGDIIWGNQVAMSSGDPNTHAGLAAWGTKVLGAPE